MEKVLCTDVRAIFVINNRHLEKGLGHLQQCWKKPWKDAPGLQLARKRQQLPLGQLLFYQLPQHLKAAFCLPHLISTGRSVLSLRDSFHLPL